MRKVIYLSIFFLLINLSAWAQWAPAAPDAQEWAEKKRDKLKTMTRAGWLELGEGYKQAAVSELTPQQVTNLWIGKINQVLNDFKWTRKERKHIEKLRTWLQDTPNAYSDKKTMEEQNEAIRFIDDWSLYAKEKLGWTDKLIFGIAVSCNDLLDKEGNVKVVSSNLLDKEGDYKTTTKVEVQELTVSEPVLDENVPDLTMVDQQGKKVEVKFDTLTTDRKYYLAGNSVTIFPGKTPLYFDAQNKPISEEAFVDSINNTGRYVFSVRDTTEHSLWTLTERERPPQKVLGKKLPCATLTDLQGNMHMVGHDTCGVTLVAFWSVTCPPCIEKLIVLNIVKKEFPGVAFVAVTQDKWQTVLDFMSRRNLKWNNLTLVTDYKGEFDAIVRPRLYLYDDCR